MTDRLKTLALWILDDCVTMLGDDDMFLLSSSTSEPYGGDINNILLCILFTVRIKALSNNMLANAMDRRTKISYSLSC